jgi:hypothetical protein
MAAVVAIVVAALAVVVAHLVAAHVVATAVVAVATAAASVADSRGQALVLEAKSQVDDLAFFMALQKM